jgi:putative pbsx phage terminase small subunit
MDKQDLRDLLRKEYENGAGITELCRKYNQSINTVKSWKKRDGWKKKQINAPLTNAPPKKKSAPPKINGANEKEIKIQQDILNGMSKNEVMEKYGIKKSAYYKKAKNIRQIRQERTEEYLERIVDEVYKGDIYKILKNTEVAKANLIIKTTNELSNKEETNIKKIQEYEKAYQTIKKMGMDLMRTGKMLTPYEMLEIEQQLVNEELLQEKLDLEKKKIEGEQIKDTKVEFKFKEKEIEELEDKKNE